MSMLLSVLMWTCLTISCNGKVCLYSQLTLVWLCQQSPSVLQSSMISLEFSLWSCTAWQMLAALS